MNLLYQDKRDETFARSLNALTVSNKAIATATQKQAKEAEDRNGHLADIAMENKKSNYEQSREILKAINTLPTQHIAVQTVDNQVIKEVE